MTLPPFHILLLIDKLVKKGERPRRIIGTSRTITDLQDPGRSAQACRRCYQQFPHQRALPQILNPALEDFPQGLVYVYRSPNLYGGETGARNNTSFIVFPDARFETKREARAYLKKLGLIKLVDEAVGTIILIQLEKGTCGENDLQISYTLINALFSHKASVEADGKRAVPAEAEYCGGYGKTYMSGVGRGATLMNNYVAPSRDELIGRVAGYFTYGGEMCDAVKVSQYVPAFIVNGCGVAVQKFRRANKTNAYSLCQGVSRFYNQAVPLRQVRRSRETGEIIYTE